MHTEPSLVHADWPKCISGEYRLRSEDRPVAGDRTDGPRGRSIDRSGGRLCWLYSGVAAESALSDRKFTLARLDQVSLRWLES